MPTLRLSAIVLIAVNSLPLFGVWFFDWSTFDVIFLYWAENVVIGVINVLRMITARPNVQNLGGFSAAQRSRAGRALNVGSFIMIPFFAVHYGMFCYGHQVFVVGMFGDDRTIADVLANTVIWLGILAIAASHLFSFIVNFLMGGEFRRIDAKSLMMQPYERIIVLHVAIIFGGFLLQTIGEPSLLLVVLILAKIVIDLKQHERERSVLASANTLDAAQG